MLLLKQHRLFGSVPRWVRYEMNSGTTIAAIATAIVPQEGSIGIVRLSGPEAVAIAKQLFDAPGQQVWDSHRVLYGHVCDPQTLLYP
jgi:tRNA modification GTPase